MDAAAILVIALQASIFVSVLSYGMQSSVADFLYLFRRPGMLIRALISMNVVMPLFVGIVVVLFRLDTVVEIALIALACCPVPPILRSQALTSDSQRSFAFGLLAASALLSLIIIPAIFRIFNSVFQRQEHFSALGVLKAILITVILPLVIGIAMHHFARALSDRYAVRIGRIGFLLLIVAFLPMLISLLGPMWSLVGNGTIMALIAFALVGVTAGHFLGGQDPADRTVLSLATASRHPAIAVALTSGNMIEAQRKSAAAAIVLYLLVSTIVVGPYLNWLGTYEAEKERLSEA